MTDSRSPVTQLLAAVGRGDASAHEQLWALIYDELRALARGQLADEACGHRRQPTSLVHDAYLRLTQGQAVEWSSRRKFFAAAATAMRRIRIDDARKRKRLKRGGDQHTVALREGALVVDSDPTEVLAIDEALRALGQKDPRKVEVVTLRYFAGLTIDECAEVLGVAPKTVDNDWRFARAWLHGELSADDHGDSK